jgi:hypothetical protein
MSDFQWILHKGRRIIYGERQEEVLMKFWTQLRMQR